MTQMQLQITEVKIKTSTADLSSIQIVHKENKIANFWKEIFNRNSKLIFKLEKFNNYKSWRDEALTQALEIKTKSILKNIKINSSDSLISDNDKLIWKIKNKALFNMLLSIFKFIIRQIIKNRIDKDNKNTAELWTALETEYKTHAADTKFELIQKFFIILIDNYNKNVQTYISNFWNICDKFKIIRFEIITWMKNNKFITDL